MRMNSDTPPQQYLHNLQLGGLITDYIHFQRTSEDMDHTEGGWGCGVWCGLGSEAPGQQPAATSGKICTAVLRLERHS